MAYGFVDSCLQTCVTYTIAECTVNKTIFLGMKLYMFRRVHLSIISILFTVYSAMVYDVQVCRQLSTNLYDIYHC